MKYLLLTITVIVIALHSVSAQSCSAVISEDFSSRTSSSPGFYADPVFTYNSCTSQNGVIGVYPANAGSQYGTTPRDHTTGAGNYLISMTPNNPCAGPGTVWSPGTTAARQAVTVEAGRSYTFSAWLVNISGASPSTPPGSLLSLRWSTNGTTWTTIASFNTYNTTAWTQLSGTFTPAASNVYIDLYNASSSVHGNDFGVDDISLISTPPAPSISLNCGVNSRGQGYGRLFETNGTSWLWTSAGPGRFYADNSISILNDSDVSHLQGPYIAAWGTYFVKITDAFGCTGTGDYTVASVLGCTVLAETGLQLKAADAGNWVKLQWHTLALAGTSYFIVERSADGVNWQTIGQRKQDNTGNDYEFIDKAPISGKSYYRLKLVNVNGGLNYSNIAKTNTVYGLTPVIYPNPAANGQLQTVAFSVPAGVARVQITAADALGRLLYNTVHAVAPGKNYIQLHFTITLQPGVYFLKITGENWVSNIIKFTTF